MGSKKTVSINSEGALVIGGGGFVGRAIVKMLLASGIKVSVLGRKEYPDLELQGVTCHQGSIVDYEVVKAAMDGVDLVFHTAALAGIWGKWEEYHAINEIGTRNVVDSCEEMAVHHLVYTSTPSVVFNGSDLEGGGENLPYATDFLCHYAKSKAAAERYVLAAASGKLKCCAIRPHLVWGPGDPHLLPRLIERGKKQKLKIVGSGRNKVSISYVDNVAYAHLLAAKNLLAEDTQYSANGKVYFISQEEPVFLWNWINELFSLAGVPQVKKQIPFEVAYGFGWCLEKIYTLFSLPGEPPMTRFLAEQLAKSHYFSLAGAKRDLGYKEIVSSEEGLRRTVEWLQNQ